MGLPRHLRLPAEAQDELRAALALAWRLGIHARALAVACGTAPGYLTQLRMGNNSPSPATARRVLHVLMHAPDAWYGHREERPTMTLNEVQTELRIAKLQLVGLEEQRQAILRRVERLGGQLMEAAAQVGQLQRAAGQEAISHPSKPLEGL